LGGGVDIALDYDLPDNVIDETVDLEGYTVVNAFAEYAPPQLETLTLRAEVSNLLDLDYADRATYGNDFASVTTLNEPGRTLSLTAVARF
jgi:hemoglobin/transferrin/lactoferrin receptor protein